MAKAIGCTCGPNQVCDVCRFSQAWPEERVDIIGQNGNNGEHYAEPLSGVTTFVCALCGHKTEGILAEHGFLRCDGCLAHYERDTNGVWQRKTKPEPLPAGHFRVTTTPVEAPPPVDENVPIGKRVADVLYTEMLRIKPTHSLHTNLELAAENVKWEAVFDLRDLANAARNVGVEVKFERLPVTDAVQFLNEAAYTLAQRGSDYDKPEGERSAGAVAQAFNAITRRDLTEAEVWLILQLVKDVRQWQNPGRYHADSALDCVAYAALKAEALAAQGDTDA